MNDDFDMCLLLFLFQRQVEGGKEERKGKGKQEGKEQGKEQVTFLRLEL